MFILLRYGSFGAFLVLYFLYFTVERDMEKAKGGETDGKDS